MAAVPNANTQTSVAANRSKYRNAKFDLPVRPRLLNPILGLLGEAWSAGHWASAIEERPFFKTKPGNFRKNGQSIVGTR
jgi:hypothetical protein